MDVDRRARRRVLGGVLQQVGERRGGQPRIEPHRHVRIDLRPQLVPAQRVLDLVARRGDDLGRMRPPRFGGDGAGIDARHLEDILEQPGQALDLGQDQIALFPAVLGRQRRRLEFAGGDADRGERRPQIVSERGEQRGLQLLALPRQLARLALLEKLRALDRDRDDAAERVERAGLDGRPAAASSPIGLVPTRSGTSRIVRPSTSSSGGRRRSARRRRIRARSGRARMPRQLAACPCAIVTRPLRTCPSLAARQRNGDKLQVESAGDRSRQHRDRFPAVGDHQHVAAQVEQPRQLVASSDGFFVRARATADRLLATRLTARKANSATQFCGSAIVNVPTGGRKEEVEAEHRATEVATATHSRDVAATTRTTIRKVVDTVAAFETCSHCT